MSFAIGYRSESGHVEFEELIRRRRVCASRRRCRMSALSVYSF